MVNLPVGVAEVHWNGTFTPPLHDSRKNPPAWDFFPAETGYTEPIAPAIHSARQNTFRLAVGWDAVRKASLHPDRLSSTPFPLEPRRTSSAHRAENERRRPCGWRPYQPRSSDEADDQGKQPSPLDHRTL